MDPQLMAKESRADRDPPAVVIVREPGLDAPDRLRLALDVALGAGRATCAEEGSRPSIKPGKAPSR